MQLVNRPQQFDVMVMPNVRCRYTPTLSRLYQLTPGLSSFSSLRHVALRSPTFPLPWRVAL